jgi:hypothetical protein
MGSEQTLNEEYLPAKGNRRWQGRVGEQSYDPSVPMKVGNRRASERSGHDTHWRDGANR